MHGRGRRCSRRSCRRGRRPVYRASGADQVCRARAGSSHRLARIPDQPEPADTGDFPDRGGRTRNCCGHRNRNSCPFARVATPLRADACRASPIEDVSARTRCGATRATSPAAARRLPSPEPVRRRAAGTSRARGRRRSQIPRWRPAPRRTTASSRRRKRQQQKSARARKDKLRSTTADQKAPPPPPVPAPEPRASREPERDGSSPRSAPRNSNRLCHCRCLLRGRCRCRHRRRSDLRRSPCPRFPRSRTDAGRSHLPQPVYPSSASVIIGLRHAVRAPAPDARPGPLAPPVIQHSQPQAQVEGEGETRAGTWLHASARRRTSEPPPVHVPAEPIRHPRSRPRPQTAGRRR